MMYFSWSWNEVKFFDSVDMRSLLLLTAQCQKSRLLNIKRKRISGQVYNNWKKSHPQLSSHNFGYYLFELYPGLPTIQVSNGVQQFLDRVH